MSNATFHNSDFEIKQLAELTDAMGATEYKISTQTFNKSAHAERACESEGLEYLTVIRDDQGQWHYVSI